MSSVAVFAVVFLILVALVGFVLARRASTRKRKEALASSSAAAAARPSLFGAPIETLYAQGRESEELGGI